MLRKLEPEMRKVIQNFAKDKIVVSCIDRCHEKPAQLRPVLDNHKNLPHRIEIELGLRTLDLTASHSHAMRKGHLL